MKLQIISTFSWGSLASSLSVSKIIIRYSMQVNGPIVLCAAMGTFENHRELLQLLRHLNFASRVIVPGRSFVSYLIDLSTKVKELHYYDNLRKQCS
jgi:hypothetical protein